MFAAVITAASGLLTRATLVVDYRDDRVTPPVSVLVETYREVDVSTALKRQAFIAGTVLPQVQALKASGDTLKLQEFVGRVVASI